MQFPKLTPLQSRLAACLGTSIVLLIIYYSISPSHFAYASELESILNEDHNHHWIDLATDIDWSEDTCILETDGFTGTGEYQAEFPGVVRELVGRAPPGVAPLKNNVPSIETNIAPGDLDPYVFKSTEVYGPSGVLRTGLPWNISRSDGTVIQKRDGAAGNEGMDTELYNVLKRQATNGTVKTVYISVNTCLQPLMKSGRKGSAPQLTLYISANESAVTSVGSDNALQIPLEQGYISATVNATGDVFFSVVANNLTDDFVDGAQWAYTIAASVDASYFYYEDTPFIWTVDTDSNSALLATLNLTDANPGVSNQTKALRQQWMDMTTSPPFTMRIYNSSSPNITGVERSYCGLQKQGINPITINSSMTQRGVGQNPKQQFYVTGLRSGQNYTAILAYDGVNMTNQDVVAGGGQLWKAIPFTTKTVSEDNCKIVYDLPFCDSVAYAVPTNPKNESLTVSELKLTYDNYASALFKNFTNSLDQIQCHTAETAQYSLATNCDLCSQNYKLWLCAVTIPRCEDFSNNNNFLQARNIGHAFSNGTVPQFNVPGDQAPQVQAASRLLYNSSRNPMIDQVIKPGPYKELLPCQELCFDLVQACPTALQFTCPKANGYAGGILSNSYGTYDPAKVSPNDFVTCNFLGVDWPSLSEGRRLGIGGMGWTLVVGVALFLVRG